jgi:predicted nucleic acid-binding Zn ribbon protein
VKHGTGELPWLVEAFHAEEKNRVRNRERYRLKVQSVQRLSICIQCGGFFLTPYRSGKALLCSGKCKAVRYRIRWILGNKLASPTGGRKHCSVCNVEWWGMGNVCSQACRAVVRRAVKRRKNRHNQMGRLQNSTLSRAARELGIAVRPPGLGSVERRNWDRAVSNALREEINVTLSKENVNGTSAN